jgi:glycosyltransferase involved in cell wall biosynthesis
MGRFDRTGVAEAYASFDVLVVPSLWPENSPLVIHEAQQHGAAIVAARMGGIPELVSDGVNGSLYDASSVDELRARLQQFVDDPALASRLASAAPRVKTIAEDACEWEERYSRLLCAGRAVRSPNASPV